MTPCRLANSYQMSAWSRALLETLIVPQLIKKFNAFYENRIFVSAFTKARPRVIILIQINPVHPLIVVFIEDLF